MKWMYKNSIPPVIGWYYVENLDGSVSSRYWDDSGKYDDSRKGVWFHATDWDGFTPNDSFIKWLFIPDIHIR